MTTSCGPGIGVMDGFGGGELNESAIRPDMGHAPAAPDTSTAISQMPSRVGYVPVKDVAVVCAITGAAANAAWLGIDAGKGTPVARELISMNQVNDVWRRLRRRGPNKCKLLPNRV